MRSTVERARARQRARQPQLPEAERAQRHNKRVATLIHFWERIREVKDWTDAMSLAPRNTAAAQRWVRRQLYFLEAAGLVERRVIPRRVMSGPRTFFRRRRESNEKQF